MISSRHMNNTCRTTALPSRILQNITQSQMSLITQLGTNPQLPNIDQTLALMSKQAELVNNQQAATSQAHQAYIQSQTAFSQQYMALLQELIAKGETITTAGASPSGGNSPTRARGHGT